MLYCRAADTFYIRMYASGGFKYSLSYEVSGFSAKDVEPNNTFGGNGIIKFDTTYNGHINYQNNGVTDANDYYQALRPFKGTVRIITEAKNTSGGNGFMQHLHTKAGY